MYANPLQFAVVREDPRVEIALIERHGGRRVLLVGSGGCTALALRARFPDLAVTVADPNPAQLAHIRAKADRLAAHANDPGADRAALLADFNVGTDDPGGLSERGNFEALFRGWRRLLHDLVLPSGLMRAGFDSPERCAGLRTALTTHRYWPVVFEMYFGDPLLLAMFGDAAVQHAEPGSYPAYFRRALERALAQPGAWNNPFLHHLLLGHYLDRPGALPECLAPAGGGAAIDYVQGCVGAAGSFGDYDVIGLSNVCDWMNRLESGALFARIRTEARPGAVVLWRQLNNTCDLASHLGSRFRFDPGHERHLYATERSCFYNRIRAGVRQ